MCIYYPNQFFKLFIAVFAPFFTVYYIFYAFTYCLVLLIPYVLFPKVVKTVVKNISLKNGKMLSLTRAFFICFVYCRSEQDKSQVLCGSFLRGKGYLSFILYVHSPAQLLPRNNQRKQRIIL